MPPPAQDVRSQGGTGPPDCLLLRVLRSLRAFNSIRDMGKATSIDQGLTGLYSYTFPLSMRQRAAREQAGIDQWTSERNPQQTALHL